ncbi:MAG: nucleotidyltransferase domain-containing protein [Pseudomonadota bacterium]
MIDLTPDELAEVKRILAEHAQGMEVWAFGSRVDGSSRKNSDLDLAIVTPAKVDWRLIERIKDAFSSSNLPFMVDVVELASLPEGVAATARKRHEVIQEAGS